MFTSLSCPQCGGALPRQALWRMVACPYCRSMVTRSAQFVQRAPFRQAYERSLAVAPDGAQGLDIAGRRYRVLGRLGEGEQCDVLLGERCGALGQRVTIKLARSSPNRLAAEADALRHLQALQIEGSAYFSQRLPQVLASGRSGAAGHERDALVLRHPTGFWGSARDVLDHHPQGIQDVRHAVWMWRRVLEVLAYVHRAGWTHGDLRAEHWLVHPADHGVLLVGWGRARQGGDAARDLMQSAWTVRALLHGHRDDHEPAIPDRVPAAMRDLLRAASEDAAWCRRLDAGQLDQALMAAAGQAFGPPHFVPFHPQRA